MIRCASCALLRPARAPVGTRGARVFPLPHVLHCSRPASSVSFRAVTDTEVLQIFRETGALLEGHFILRSGLRSKQYFQCALALQHMPTVEKLGAALAAKVRDLEPATVISPAMGGLVIGQEVAL